MTSRPGRSQGLIYKQLFDSLIQWAFSSYSNIWPIFTVLTIFFFYGYWPFCHVFDQIAHFFDKYWLFWSFLIVLTVFEHFWPFLTVIDSFWPFLFKTVFDRFLTILIIYWLFFFTVLFVFTVLTTFDNFLPFWPFFYRIDHIWLYLSGFIKNVSFYRFKPFMTVFTIFNPLLIVFEHF